MNPLRAPSFRLRGHCDLVTGTRSDIGLATATTKVAAFAVTQMVVSNALAYGASQVFCGDAGTKRSYAVADTQDAGQDAVIDLDIKAAFYVTRVVARCLHQTAHEQIKRGGFDKVSQAAWGACQFTMPCRLVIQASVHDIKNQETLQ